MSDSETTYMDTDNVVTENFTDKFVENCEDNFEITYSNALHEPYYEIMMTKMI